MITGQVNGRYEAIIPIHLQKVGGTIHSVEAILDTGFNGTLPLPTDLIVTLKLPWRTRGGAILADGREEMFDIYAATVIWDGKSRRILVEAVESLPLVGMRLLADYDVRLRVQPGGMVHIAAVPEAEVSHMS